MSFDLIGHGLHMAPLTHEGVGSGSDIYDYSEIYGHGHEHETYMNFGYGNSDSGGNILGNLDHIGYGYGDLDHTGYGNGNLDHLGYGHGNLDHLGYEHGNLDHLGYGDLDHFGTGQDHFEINQVDDQFKLYHSDPDLFDFDQSGIDQFGIHHNPDCDIAYNDSPIEDAVCNISENNHFLDGVRECLQTDQTGGMGFIERHIDCFGDAILEYTS